MITRQDVDTLKLGQTLYHTSKNADKSQLRARVNGKPQTWKTRPEEFRVPMKHGLRNTFQLVPRNAHEWFLTEQEALQHCNNGNQS